LDAVPFDNFKPRAGRPLASEQGDVGGIFAPPQPHHPRNVRPIDVGIDQANFATLSLQGKGDVDGNGCLAHAALTASDSDDRYRDWLVRHHTSSTPGVRPPPATIPMRTSRNDSVRPASEALAFP